MEAWSFPPDYDEAYRPPDAIVELVRTMVAERGER